MDVKCSCYGCTIRRSRASLRLVDRSAEVCDPSNACATHDRCWTHSEWVDEAACVPSGACTRGISCDAHGKAQA